MRDSASKAGISDLRKHPSPAEPEPGSGPIPRPRFRWTTQVLVPVGVLGGLVSLFLVTAYREVFPGVQVRAVPVVVKQLSGSLPGAVTVQAAGWVEADPYTSHVSALADGIVREILVLEGERVERDQVVARLVDDDARLAFRKAEAEVRELEAALESARAARDAARTDWENPVERVHAVSVAEAELRESKATLNQVVADLEVEEALLEKAKSDYDRARPLHVTASISDAEMVKQRSQFNAQAAKLKALQERRSVTEARIAKYTADLLKAQEQMRLRTEDRHKLDKAEAAYEQAQAALSRAGVVCDEARLRLSRMEVRSPVAGVVIKRLASPGSKLIIGSDEKHSAHVLTLYDPDHLQVRVDVPLADAGKVGSGQRAQVVVEILPDRTFSGTVTRVSHEANIQKNTLEVKVAIEKPEPQLRPEMLARVRFLAQVENKPDETRWTLFGPDEAFRKSGGTATAWVVKDRLGDTGIVHSQTVELGQHADGWTEVVKGLQPGDLLVIHAPSELTNGKRIRVAGDS